MDWLRCLCGYACGRLCSVDPIAPLCRSAPSAAVSHSRSGVHLFVDRWNLYAIGFGLSWRRLAVGLVRRNVGSRPSWVLIQNLLAAPNRGGELGGVRLAWLDAGAGW